MSLFIHCPLHGLLQRYTFLQMTHTHTKWIIIQIKSFFEHFWTVSFFQFSHWCISIQPRCISLEFALGFVQQFNQFWVGNELKYIAEKCAYFSNEKRKYADTKTLAPSSLTKNKAKCKSVLHSTIKANTQFKHHVIVNEKLF